MIEPTDAQRRVKEHPSLSLLLVAPAGCGKTESLAMRIAGLIDSGRVTPPRRVLATTFTNRAKDNLRRRLNDHIPAAVLRSHITVVNFHGLATRIIRAHAATIGLDPGITLPNGDWVKEQCHLRGLNHSVIERVERNFRTVKQQPLDDRAVAEALQAQGATIAYQIEQKRITENRATYDDLLRHAELILSIDGVADLYRNHFAAVIVDEYQDLTAQQLRVLTRIGQDRITFAGDLGQGIYGFTGAQPTNTDAVIRQTCSEIVELTESHRSSPAVLAMVNAMNTVTGGTDLHCAKPHAWPGGGLAGMVTFTDETHEASWITKMCAYIHGAAPTHRIGIIARIKSRLRFVDRALEQTGLSTHRWEDGLLDTDTAVIVKSMLTRLDTDALESTPDPLSYLREAAGADTIDEPDTRRALTDALTWVLDRVSEGSQPDELIKRIKIGNDNTLLNAAGVHLLSGHVGKGQQFDWVVIVGAEDGTQPFFRAETDTELLEEARIMSVMISRARHGILVTNALNFPTVSGYPRSRDPSPYLATLATATPLSEHAAVSWLKGAPWDQLSTC